jgi:hypothetical protein
MMFGSQMAIYSNELLDFAAFTSDSVFTFCLFARHHFEK